MGDVQYKGDKLGKELPPGCGNENKRVLGRGGEWGGGVGVQKLEK